MSAHSRHVLKIVYSRSQSLKSRSCPCKARHASDPPRLLCSMVCRSYRSLAFGLICGIILIVGFRGNIIGEVGSCQGVGRLLSICSTSVFSHAVPGLAFTSACCNNKENGLPCIFSQFRTLCYIDLERYWGPMTRKYMGKSCFPGCSNSRENQNEILKHSIFPPSVTRRRPMHHVIGHIDREKERHAI